MKKPTYEAAAWRDPVTGHINLVLAKEDEEGRRVSVDFSCATRRIEYDNVAMSPEDIEDYAPAGALVGLTFEEADVIQTALWEALNTVKRSAP
jgi:hypothetical protein